jgi:hypothetical protein
LGGRTSHHPDFVTTPATLCNGEFSGRSSARSDHSRIYSMVPEGCCLSGLDRAQNQKGT